MTPLLAIALALAAIAIGLWIAVHNIAKSEVPKEPSGDPLEQQIYCAEIGDIICYTSRHGGWFSRAQQFFTGIPQTHVAIVLGQVHGMWSVLEAKNSVTVTPIPDFRRNDRTDVGIFRLDFAPAATREQVAAEMYRKHAGADYGFAQVLYFVWVWFWTRPLWWWFVRPICRHFGHGDPLLWRNRIPNGQICTELVHEFCEAVAANRIVMRRFVGKASYGAPVLAQLDTVNRNNVSAGYMTCILQTLTDDGMGVSKVYEVNNQSDRFKQRFQ